MSLDDLLLQHIPQVIGHVVNAWLGNSAKVAEKHYLQIRPDDWDKAATIKCSTGADIPALSEPTPNDTKSKNRGKSGVSMTTNGQVFGHQYPRQNSNL